LTIKTIRGIKQVFQLYYKKVTAVMLVL